LHLSAKLSAALAVPAALACTFASPALPAYAGISNPSQHEVSATCSSGYRVTVINQIPYTMNRGSAYISSEGGIPDLAIDPGLSNTFCAGSEANVTMQLPYTWTLPSASAPNVRFDVDFTSNGDSVLCYTDVTNNGGYLCSYRLDADGGVTLWMSHGLPTGTRKR
jgi:hypothetical protein